jgi:hypothetical protein
MIKKCRNAYITPTVNSLTESNWEARTEEE